ncbi:hypothetical protein MNBD_GAMMA10-1832, partial [hydrothermal vent metagenome]
MWYRHFTRILFIVCVSLAYTCASGVRADDKTSHHVKDLAYGVSLFNYFQQKYFSAITELLIAEHYQRISSGDKNPPLLLGGLYLSYDLHKQSADVFRQLLGDDSLQDENLQIPLIIKDQAHFLLGKNHFHDADYAKAEAQFISIRDGLKLDSEEEKLFLLNTIFLRNDDFEQAEKTLDYFSSSSVWKGYAQFNTASRLIQHTDGDNIELGFDLLEDLAEDNSGDDSSHIEKRILRDKANLALAYVALRDGHSRLSIEYFNKITLKGIETNKALLG